MCFVKDTEKIQRSPRKLGKFNSRQPETVSRMVMENNEFLPASYIDNNDSSNIQDRIL